MLSNCEKYKKTQLSVILRNFDFFLPSSSIALSSVADAESAENLYIEATLHSFALLAWGS